MKLVSKISKEKGKDSWFDFGLNINIYYKYNKRKICIEKKILWYSSKKAFHLQISTNWMVDLILRFYQSSSNVFHNAARVIICFVTFDFISVSTFFAYLSLFFQVFCWFLFMGPDGHEWAWMDEPPWMGLTYNKQVMDVT